jgi:hypothetical protein
MASTAPAVTVALQARDSALEATISDPRPPAGTQYAIYLLRDGERVATRGYTAAPQAVFAGPHRSGTYTATGFCLDPATGTKRKAHAAPLAVSSVAPARALKLPPPITVTSVEALAEALRPDEAQRLDLVVDALTYSLVTGPRRPGPLFLLLRGAEPDRGVVPLPRFSRYSWREDFPGTVVCIADPTLHLDDKLMLGWYFGSADHDVVAHLCRITEALCARLDLTIADAVFYGSSGGGFAAMQCAARLGRGATAVAVNPQTDVLRFPIAATVDAFLAACCGGLGREEASRRFGARLSLTLAWQRHPAAEARCVIVQNTSDRAHYRDHYGPFAKAWGVQDNGRSADGRMASITYAHPSGHAAEPREMVPRIVQTALELRWQPVSAPPAAAPEHPMTTLLERIAARKPRQDFLNHTYISLRHGYLYAAVGKAANSTVKHHLYELEYEGTRFKTKSLHDRQSSPLLSPFQLPPDLLDDVLTSPKYFRFTVVRNPYSRLLSCYLDRIVPASSQPYRQLMALLRRKEGDPVSFDEFVRAVCAQRPYDQNNHWRLQVAEVCHGDIHYDDVGKQETFAADMARMWPRLARGRPMPDFSAENKAPSITSAERRLAEFYTGDLVDLVRVAYRSDFETFGYSMDPE